jgi:hypothetical protein
MAQIVDENGLGSRVCGWETTLVQDGLPLAGFEVITEACEDLANGVALVSKPTGPLTPGQVQIHCGHFSGS